MAIETSGKITYENIFSKSYANIFNLINTRTNVADPLDSTGARKFVYSRFPNIDGRNFAGFPFIVITRSKPNKVNAVVSMTKSDMLYEITISVYSWDNVSDSTGDPKGAEYVDTISNSIAKTLDNITNKKTLLFYGLGRLEYDVTTDEDELRGKLVFNREFTLRFKDILTTSE